MSYLLQLLVAIDQLGNALLAGWADETLSARAWRQRRKRRWAIVKTVVDGIARVLGQTDHCRKAYESELLRHQLPPEERFA